MCHVLPQASTPGIFLSPFLFHSLLLFFSSRNFSFVFELTLFSSSYLIPLYCRLSFLDCFYFLLPNSAYASLCPGLVCWDVSPCAFSLNTFILFLFFFFFFFSSFFLFSRDLDPILIQYSPCCSNPPRRSPSCSSSPLPSCCCPSFPLPSSRAFLSPPFRMSTMVSLAIVSRASVPTFTSDTPVVSLPSLSLTVANPNTTRRHLQHQKQRLQPPHQYSPVAVLHSHRSSRRCFPHPCLSLSSRRRALPCPVAFPPLPPGLADPPPADPARHPSRLPCRYLALRPPSGLGRVDCAGRNHHSRLVWRRHLRHAPHPRQSQGQEEAHC